VEVKGLLVMLRANLDHLSPTGQQGLLEFVQLLKEQFNGRVHTALLFGSKARGEGTPDSDLDVLIVVDSDDWRVHKQIRYLAADVCLEYSLNLTPRVEHLSSTGGSRTPALVIPEHPPR
jgi:predicted nucleotidyltransferase